VPEAIVAIKAAGIRFWVLTGDKTETAVEIVRACRLFTEDMILAYMVNCTSEKHAMQLIEEAKTKLAGTENGGLVLDGTFTQFCLASPEAKKELYSMAIATKSCVCCRLSPQQKRKLVDLVRKENTLGITLAIGDGANDVSMIQGAHIGIGVRGKEGNQAVTASDVAVSQFRFLVPLLLCHGRRAYRRVATFLCYYIYKHIVVAVADVIWAHQFRFRGEIAYPEWLASSYSLIFTSLPVMVILCFDKGLPDAVALAEPGLYIEGLQRMRFNFKVFSTWMISGLWHGTLAWLVPSLLIGSKEFFVADENNKYQVKMVPDFWLGSCASFTLVVLLVDLRLWMVSLNTFAIPTVGILFLSILSYWITLFTVQGLFGMQPQIDGIPSEMLQDSRALLCIFLTPLALLVDLALFQAAKVFFPYPLDKARWKYRFSSGGQGAEDEVEPKVVKVAEAW